MHVFLNEKVDEDTNSSRSLHSLQLFLIELLASFSAQEFLGPSVKKFGLQEEAITSLASSCTSYNARLGVENGNDATLFSIQVMECLVAIFTSEYSTEETTTKLNIILRDAEAIEVASKLGPTISSLVMSRLVAHVTNEEQQGGYHSRQKSANDLAKAPEVVLLCALGSQKEALGLICQCGGLEALSLVATIGHLSAINVLHMVSRCTRL